MKIYIEKKVTSVERVSREHGHVYCKSTITIYGDSELPLCEDSFYMYFAEERNDAHEWSYEDPFSYGENVSEEVSEDKANEQLLISMLSDRPISIGKKEECPYVLGKRYSDFCQLSNYVREEEKPIWIEGLNKLQIECERPRYEMMKSYMLNGEFDINEPIPKNGNSALGESYIYNDPAYAYSLIEKGAWFVEYDSYKSTFEGYDFDKYYKDGKLLWEKERVARGMYGMYKVKKHEEEKVQEIQGIQIKGIDLNKGLKTIEVNAIRSTQVATRKKLSEWTQNMNVLKFVISELGIESFHKLLDNMRSHYSSIPCEYEITVIEFKYYLKQNDIEEIRDIIENHPKLKKMLVCKGLPTWYDNEYVNLYFESNSHYKEFFDKWRIHEKDNVSKKEQFVAQHPSREDILIGDAYSTVFWALHSNDIHRLKTTLDRLPSDEQKRIVLGDSTRINLVVDAYFECNLETKTFFDNWRFKGWQQYKRNEKFQPLYYRGIPIN